ncbi:MAG: hypothetical protein WKG01_10170 [Kofleriaceae bacterium]
MRALAIVLALVACSDRKEAPPATPPVVPPDAAVAAVAPDASVVPRAQDGAAPPSVAGANFLADAQLLYRIAGCANETPVDDKLQNIVDQHCKAIAPHVAKFREVYFVGAPKWLAEHVPAEVPKTVVSPFGGGDLLSALAVFPHATEITTVSLELAGDPRRAATLEPKQLQTDLATFRKEIGWLIQVGSNTSVNLSAQQRNNLPGQVTSFLLALAIGGYEPTAMRFFTLDDQGAIKYLEQADIDTDKRNTRSLSGSWRDPNFAEAFRNVELRFRKLGETAEQVHRHIAWNLGDKELAAHPGLLRHLEAKGKVTMIVKGASYLLWQNDFRTMRRYILEHLAFMLSDSTGIPPMYAKPAGMELEPYGKFVMPGLPHAVGGKEDHDMRELWKSSRGPAPFRFGYIDNSNNHHLLITRPAT